MKQIGLSELNAVVALAARSSFRAAAVDLNMSPSTLSHAIAGLEHRLGVRLFQRTTRSVSLTQAGEQFLGRIQPALREISGAIDDVNSFRDTPTGTLRINSSEGAARQALGPILLQYLALYPDMVLDVVTEGRFVDIVAEGFDAGIRLLESVPQNMIAAPFGPEQRFAVVAAPSYFRTRSRPVSPADLLTHDCVRRRLPSGTLYRWEFEKNGEEVAIDVPGPVIFDNDILMLEAALQGTGLAFLSEYAVSRFLADGRLVRVLYDWTPPYGRLALYYSGHRHVAAGLRALVELIRVDRPGGDHAASQGKKLPIAG